MWGGHNAKMHLCWPLVAGIDVSRDFSSCGGQGSYEQGHHLHVLPHCALNSLAGQQGFNTQPLYLGIVLPCL